MKLPTTIKIGPFIYSVVESRLASMNQKLGIYNSIEQQILIAKDQHPQSLVDTLLHECLHGITFHGDKAFKDEEGIVRSLTPWLIQLIKDNPELIKLIQEV